MRIEILFPNTFHKRNYLEYYITKYDSQHGITELEFDLFVSQEVCHANAHVAYEHSTYFVKDLCIVKLILGIWSKVDKVHTPELVRKHKSNNLDCWILKPVDYHDKYLSSHHENEIMSLGHLVFLKVNKKGQPFLVKNSLMDSRKVLVVVRDFF